MKKIAILWVLLLFCQLLPAQTRHDLEQTPTILLYDSIAKKDSLSFTVITKKQFLSFKAKQKNILQASNVITKDTDSTFTFKTKSAHYKLLQSAQYSGTYAYNGYLPLLRSHLISFCGEGTCQAYLLDNETDVKMAVPASFDAGVIDITASPSGSFVLVYSSYDGPDYKDYYSHRAEFIVYKMIKGKGLKGLTHYYTFETPNWSVKEIVWINNNAIALKIYEGQSPGDNAEIGYSYIKTVIK